MFLDSGAATALQWTAPGGVAGWVLEKGGANYVKDIGEIKLDDEAGHEGSAVEEEGHGQQAGDFQPLLPAPSTRVAFIISRPIPSHLRRIRRELLSHGYDACYILSGFSEGAHAALAELQYPHQGRDRGEEDTGTEPDDVVKYWAEARKSGGNWERDVEDAYFMAVEARLRRWLLEGRERHPPESGEDLEEPEISVLHLPLASYVDVSDRFFVVPNCHLFPLLDPARYLADADPKLGNLSVPLQRRFMLAAASISDFLDALDVQDHIYSVGQSADVVARLLTDKFGTTSRRRSGKSASLVIVDRTLDMVPPVSFSDNLFDLIARAFPDSSFLDAAVSSDLASFPASLPLAHASDSQKLSMLSTLLSFPSRESLVRLRKRLADAVNKDAPESFKTPGKLPVKVTQAQISRLLAAFKGDDSLLLKYAPIVETMSLAEKALAAAAASEEALSAEKVLLLALSQGDDEDAGEQAVEQWKTLLPDSAATPQGQEKLKRALNLLINLWMRLSGRTSGLITQIRDALLKCLLAEGPGAASEDEEEEEEEADEFDSEWGWGEDSAPPSPRKEAKKQAKAMQQDKGGADDRYKEWRQRKSTLEFEVDVFVERLEMLRRAQSRAFGGDSANPMERPPLVARIVSELCAPKSPQSLAGNALSSALGAGSALTSAFGAGSSALSSALGSSGLSSTLGSWLKPEDQRGGAGGSSELRHHSYGLISYGASAVAGGISGVLRTVQTAAMKTIEPSGNKILIIFVLGGITGAEVQAAIHAWEQSRGGVEELLIGSGGMAGDVAERLGTELLRSV